MRKIAMVPLFAVIFATLSVKAGSGCIVVQLDELKCLSPANVNYSIYLAEYQQSPGRSVRCDVVGRQVVAVYGTGSDLINVANGVSQQQLQNLNSLDEVESLDFSGSTTVAFVSGKIFESGVGRVKMARISPNSLEGLINLRSAQANETYRLRCQR